MGLPSLRGKFVRSIARNFGFDLRRYNALNSTDAQLMTMFSYHGVNLVFDVGANSGQYGAMLRQLGYAGRIVSFEPLRSAHAALKQRARGDSLWDVAPRTALGEKNGTACINVAANLVSSSILSMLKKHETLAPGSEYLAREEVAVQTFDTIVDRYLTVDCVSFLKIDTQGYEERVLDGAQERLKCVAGLQLEMSLVQLYEGEKLFGEMLEHVAARGFSPWAMIPSFVDEASGRLLQIDAVFFRS